MPQVRLEYQGDKAETASGKGMPINRKQGERSMSEDNKRTLKIWIMIDGSLVLAYILIFIATGKTGMN
jgi:hypothetical protein